MIDDSDDTGFPGYRISQIRHTPVDYPIITLLSYCCFTLEKVTRIHLEGGNTFGMSLWTYITISIFFILRRENIFHIINKKIKNPNLLQAMV